MFDDEEPTNPMLKVVQYQLNASASVAGDEFLAAAYLLMYESGNPHWNESAIDDVYHVNDEDIVSVMDETNV